MKILVDADACPVKHIIEELAKINQLDVLMVSNHHHGIYSDYAQVLMVDAYSQSVDLAIVNRTKAGDIVITQDYGLAAMVLPKNALAVHPSGREFTKHNIDSLLASRYLNQKAREAKVRVPKAKKRVPKDDLRFRNVLKRIIEENIITTED